MSYINTETGQYPISEAEIRAAYPNTSFGVPFTAPDEYAVVFPSPQPSYESITHSVREMKPVISSKGQWEQQWELVSLSAEEVATNISAAKDRLKESATSQRWKVMTGGITLNNISTGTDIDDQNRITSVVANASLVGLSDTDTVDFKSASGWITVTIGEIKGIAGAIGRHVQDCYTVERTHHESIDLLSTPEEVKNYDVTTGWPS